MLPVHRTQAIQYSHDENSSTGDDDDSGNANMGDGDDDNDSMGDDDGENTSMGDDDGKNNWVWVEFRGGVPLARISGSRPPRIYAKRKFYMRHRPLRHHPNISMCHINSP